MTKPSTIMVRLARPLRFAPPADLEAFKRVVFGWMQGLNPEHDRRWRRTWNRLYHARERQPMLHLENVVERSRPFHARWMAIETRLYASQDGFYNLGGFREWLKTGAAFGHYEASSGQLVFVPSSLKWEECSDDVMREFTEDALAFLHSPHALQVLWPAARDDARIHMLEQALNPPREEGA